MSSVDAPDTHPDAVAFTVVKGQPGDEELAAITVVLAARRRERARPHAPRRAASTSGWTSYWAAVRHRIMPGRDAWRATLRR